MLSWVSSHDLHWENIIDKQKRFINATEGNKKIQKIEKLGKIEKLALHLVLFIQIRQLKEKTFPLVMRCVSAIVIGVR